MLSYQTLTTYLKIIWQEFLTCLGQESNVEEAGRAPYYHTNPRGNPAFPSANQTILKYKYTKRTLANRRINSVESACVLFKKNVWQNVNVWSIVWGCVGPKLDFWDSMTLNLCVRVRMCVCGGGVDHTPVSNNLIYIFSTDIFQYVCKITGLDCLTTKLFKKKILLSIINSFYKLF
jgi:hypothetical protein